MIYLRDTEREREREREREKKREKNECKIERNTVANSEFIAGYDRQGKVRSGD